MKHLKSTANDLQAIVERSLVARDLAEPLASFDADQAAVNVRAFMEKKQYDVVGVRIEGLVEGYVRLADLPVGNRRIDTHLMEFDGDTIYEFSGIKGVLERLRDFDPSPVFVAGRDNHVWGIVTRGDLQKAPIRMYLFGLITLLEMQLTRLVRNYYPNEEWRHWLNGRLDEAQKIFSDRSGRNEQIDLVDCLPLTDKKTIVANSDQLRSRLGFTSKTKAESTLHKLKGLRDTLAHGNDILAGCWPELVDLAARAETLLRRCEDDEYESSLEASADATV